MEVGYGLEGVLTDAISSQIISSVMIPEFKNGKMSEGVKEGVFAFIFAVFFLIFKDVFKRNSHGGSLPMSFRRGGLGSNGGGASGGW
nr:TPM domain-containing protein [Campylobacter concisus]